MHVFFTATKVRHLGQLIQNWRKKQLAEIESKQGIKLSTMTREDEWEVNQKYIAADYFTSYLFIDVLAVVPFFLASNAS